MRTTIAATLLRRALLCLTTSLACGASEPPDATAAPTGTSSTASTSSSTGASSSDSSGVGGEITGSSESRPDLGGGRNSCSVWVQDCPAGQKCAPWANDGGGVWNDSRCVFIHPEPAQLYELCTVEGTAGSGIDTCDIGSMCWNGDSGFGICIPLCGGSPAQPQCAGSTECASGHDGFVNLCMPQLDCHPLLQDCPEGEACHFDYAFESTFRCFPDLSPGVDGQQDDPCTAFDECDPGFVCAGGYNGSFCTAYCDTTDSAACDSETYPSCASGFFDDAPPGFENVGVCI